MPCSYIIDADSCVAELTAYGKITKEEVIHRFKCILNDPAWTPGFSVLSDYTTADVRAVVPGDLDELLEVAVQMRKKIEMSKFAIIANSTLQFALFRMWNLKGGENIMQMQCFRSRIEAFEWLAGEKRPVAEAFTPLRWPTSDPSH